MKKNKIITLTLNPAFDLHCKTENFALHKECFAEMISLDVGGKGVNISRALKKNGQENVAVVVVGMENASEFCKGLERDNLTYIDVWTEGRIRENLTLHEENKAETRISFNGFPCDEKVLNKIEHRLGEVEAGTIITFSGAIPAGIEVGSVKELLAKFRKNGAKIVVDSRSFSFKDLVELGPWLIKPNKEEAQAYYGKPIKNKDDAVEIAKKFRDGGIENVLISLGSEGAILCCPTGIYQASVPAVEAVSTIGAGDSLIAGFIDAYLRKYGVEDGLRQAVAFGTAACMQTGTRPPETADIERVKKSIVIECLA